MNAELNKFYRAERAKGTSALNAFRVARYKLKMRDVELPLYAGDSVIYKLPRGERITLEIENDFDADMSERLQFETESARYSDAREHGAAEGWIDRDGRVLFNGWDYRSHGWEWFIDNYGFQQYWNDGKRDHSRHAAWLRARDMVARSFDYAREVAESGYVGYVVTLHDANGEELDLDSCWGFEDTGDYAAQEGYSIVEHMMAERAEYWQAETERARETVARTRAYIRASVLEWRKIKADQPGIMFSALLNYARKLRAEHSEALRVIAGSAT